MSPIEASPINYETVLEKFWDSATDGFALLDKDLRLLKVNNAWLKQAGLKREHVMGIKVYEIFPGLVKSDRINQYLKVLETGESLLLKDVQALSSNSILDISAFKLGNRLGLITTNVTEKKKYNEHLLVLNQHAVVLGNLQTLEEIVTETLDIIESLFGYSWISYLEVNDQLMHVIEIRPDNIINFEPTISVNSKGLVTLSARTGDLIHVPDIRENSDYYPSRKSTLSELVLPIKINDKVVAVINIESEIRNAFTESDVRLLQTFGGIVGTALMTLVEKKVRLEYRNQLESLYKYNLTLSGLNTVGDVMDASMNALVEVLGFKRISIGVVRGGIIQIYEARPPTDVMQIPVDSNSIMARAARTMETQLVHDVRKDPEYLEAVIEGEAPTLSELVVPVVVNGELHAMINIEHDVVNGFTLLDQHLVEMFAEQVSTSMQALMRGHRLNSLHQFGVDIMEAKSLDEIGALTMKSLKSIFGFPTGSFGVIKNDKLVFENLQGDSIFDSLDLDSVSLTINAIKTGKSQLVTDTRKNSFYINGRVSGEETLSELDVPVLVDGKAVAVINIESDNLSSFSETDQSLVEIMAQHVASAFLKVNQVNILEENVSTRTAELIEANKRLEQMNQMKTHFIGVATHELRTPLTSIRGYLELLRDMTDQTDEAIQFLNVLDRNANRLELLTDDLLDQQRINEGRLRIAQEPVNLMEILDEAILDMTPILDAKNLTLELSIEDSIELVNGDKIRLIQVIVNLLSNAIKFSADRMTITISTESMDDYVKVSVSDTGIGVASEDLTKLFEPFPDISRPYVSEASVGLGLSICKGIVDLHGGNIWAESKGLDKGTTLIFTLPKYVET